ncbi:MAG: archaeosortase/exosortase family protein [Paludibacteraceae bacterium]|jgi:exosortase/archaeosortase family protein|nr:archaeosortase/exosortase family protein [Paludibacteraceae bacterium]
MNIPPQSKKILNFLRKPSIERDCVLFITVLLLGNVVWKLLIKGSDETHPLLMGQHDIYGLFVPVIELLTHHCHTLLQWTGSPVVMDGFHLLYPDGNGIEIVWGCTALKQIFLFSILLLAASGPIHHKLWFIPVGWIMLYLFNLLRISFIVAIVGHHPEYFEILHGFILKYAFYIFIWSLWLLWEELFVKYK